MKTIIVMINLVFLLILSCTNKTNLTIKEVNSLLTENTTKYWNINSINERIISKTKVVWMFDEKGNYNIFNLKKDSLILLDNGDEVYNNKFKVLSDKEILLNGYKNNLIYISKDSLIVSDKNYKYVLIPRSPAVP